MDTESVHVRHWGRWVRPEALGAVPLPEDPPERRQLPVEPASASDQALPVKPHGTSQTVLDIACRVLEPLQLLQERLHIWWLAWGARWLHWWPL